MADPSSQVTQRYGALIRGVAAFLAGIASAILIGSSIETGLTFIFREEADGDGWTLLFWGEHWVLRVLGSWCATFASAWLAGLLSRHYGGLVAGIAAMPFSMVWGLVAVVAWREEMLIFGRSLTLDASIGNTVAAGVIAATTIPAAVFAGRLGASSGAEWGHHFDARRWSLLGVKWYHYLWLPVVLHLVVMQAAFTGFFGLHWSYVVWRSSPMSMSSLLPTIVAVAIWGTVYLLWLGSAKIYLVLSGFESVPTVGARARAIVTKGFGLLILAAVLQAGVVALQFFLIRLFR